ncbi:MAG: hypothetical protein LBF05_08140 [Tannerella sp.]|jgi:hypothetical protein|nr:hypothetical protein [Tannerella sp.]
MAGIKGKSGARKGQRKGTTNNPYGKPKGTKNKIPTSVKSDIVVGVSENMVEYWNRLKKLDDENYIRAMTNLIRLIVPRPLNEEETQSHLLKSEIIKRMMGEK